MAAFQFHLGGGGVGVNAEFFVQILAVAAFFDRFHHDIFGRHERQFFHHAPAHHLVVHDEAGRHVHVNVQYRVHREERFRHRNAFVGGIVQRPLKPLGAGGQRGVERIDDDIAGERADALAAHGIALVRHGGGADLVFLKRLFHLFKRLQDAQIVAEFVGALRKAGQHRQEVGVDLAGVSLPRNRDAPVKPEVGGDARFEFFHFGFVAVKQFHKAGLCAGGALGAEQFQRVEPVFQLFDVHDELVHPQGRTLADRGQLRRLQVGVREARHGFVLKRKRAEIPHHLRRFFQQNAGRFPKLDDVGVVADVAGSRAEVNDALGGRTLYSVRIDVRHHVVPHLALARLGGRVIDVVRVRRKLRDLRVGDVKPERLLRLRQRDPQPPPGAEFKFLREDVLHLVARVAGGERGQIAFFFVHGSDLLPQNA